MALDESWLLMELNCSGRLGVRPFVYAQKDGADPQRPEPIPTPYRGRHLAAGASQGGKGVQSWSLRPDAAAAQGGKGVQSWSLRPDAAAAQGGKGVQSWSLRPDAAAAAAQPRRGGGAQLDDLAGAEPEPPEPVPHDWHGTKDLAFTHAAALVRHLPLRSLLAEDPGGGVVVWDPFCGSGALLLEVLAAALGLPPASPAHPLPCRAVVAQANTMCIIVVGVYYRPVFSESLLGFGVSSGELLD